jgi:hypothetical protein
VTKSSKSFILEKRIGSADRRITIGKCSEMSLEAAKKQACIMLGDIAKGNDPKTGKRINTLCDITLREVLQKFLEITTYALKRLVNHSVSNDMTGRYLILDIERLRSHMCRITDAFVELLGINGNDMKKSKPVEQSELKEVTQLQIPLFDVKLM